MTRTGEVQDKVVETDILVIGGGVGGCMAALQAKKVNADVDVVLVDRGFVGKTGQSSVVSGDLAVFNPEWGHDLDFWMNSIVQAGEYLNDRKWGEILLKDSYAVFQDFEAYGVPYVKDKEGNPYRKTFGSTEACQVYGKQVMPQLRKKAKERKVRIFDRIAVTDLLKQEGRIVGAVGFHRISGDFYTFIARATILVTGNAMFKDNSFANTNAGSGHGMGYRAGAELISMEARGKQAAQLAKCDTIKFKATSWSGKWVNQKGEYFVDKYSSEFGGQVHVHKSLAVTFEVERGRGPVYIDFGTVNPEEQKLIADGYYEELTQTKQVMIERAGVKPEGRVEHIIPYAGPGQGPGLRVNLKCETTLPGLYAAGDVAGTNVCGAGYAACGIAFMHAALTGRRASEFATGYALKSEKPVVDDNEVARLKEVAYWAINREGGFRPQYVLQRLQYVIDPFDVILFKHDRSMQASLMMVEEFRDYFVPKLWAEDYHQLSNAHDVRNMVLCAEAILRSSLFRTESRGDHLRASYLYRDDENWLAWVVCNEENGKMKIWKEPMPKEYWPDLSKPIEERYSFKYLAD